MIGCNNILKNKVIHKKSKIKSIKLNPLNFVNYVILKMKYAANTTHLNNTFTSLTIKKKTIEIFIEAKM